MGKKITKKELKRLQKKEDNRRWKETRLLVLERDKHCILCTSTFKLNVHHILEKEFLLFRYLKFDMRNLVTLCPRCHKYGEFSAHKNPLFFLTILRLKYPDNYTFLLNECMELYEKSKNRK